MGFPMEEVVWGDEQPTHNVGWDKYASITWDAHTIKFEEGEFTDSAMIKLTKPLYIQVREQLDYWRLIGTPPVILDWIEHGVNISPIKPIHNSIER